MPEDNAVLFSQVVAAFNDRDVERLLELVDPEIDFQPQQAVLQGAYAGHDGVLSWLTDLTEIYAEGAVDVGQIRDLGDRFLAFGTLRFIAKGSGIQTEVPMAMLGAFRDGRMTQFKDYGDEREARAAAGLSD